MKTPTKVRHETYQARGKTCAVKGVGPSVPHSKLVVWRQSTEHATTDSQGKLAICQGAKVLSPDVFGTNRTIDPERAYRITTHTTNTTTTTTTNNHKQRQQQEQE